MFIEGEKMKKVIAGIAGMVVLALVCAPYVNGLIMEKIVRQTQQDLNTLYAETGSGITIEIMNYDRGFATSDIEWKIKLGTMSALYGINEILLTDHAKHGLTGVESTTSLARNKWFTDIVDSKLDGQNPLHITTRYCLTGSIQATINLDAFTMEEGNETVVFRPAKIVVDTDKGLRRLRTDAKWEGLQAGGRAKVDGFSIESELSKISTYIWDGDIEYDIGTILIDDPQQQLELQAFKGKYELDYENANNTLSISGDCSIAKLDVGRASITDMFLRLKINNIDARGYEEFMEIYTRSMHAVLNDLSVMHGNAEEMEEAVQKRIASVSLQMMAAYEKLLKKGLEIQVTDLHAQVPEGEIKGNLELLLKRDITFAQLAAIAAQPAMAFDLISLKTFLSFPRELAGNNPNLVVPVYPGMQTGFFMVDGDNLVHSSETRDGKLFLNEYEVIF